MFYRLCQIQGGNNGFLHLCQGAVAGYEAGQSAAGFIDSAYALFVGSAYELGRVEVGLADALNRGGGVHNLMGQHAGEPLPRLHLVLRYQFANLLA